MYDIIISYDKNDVAVSVNLTKETLIENVSNEQAVRYLKGVFTNKERFQSRFTDLIRAVATAEDNASADEFNADEFMDKVEAIYDSVTPFTYAEAFEIEDNNFRAKVFGTINISDMVESLGSTRIAVDGREVKHKKFDVDGNLIGHEMYHNVYEVYEVSGEKLGLQDNIYAVKCWCTSTNKEHWLWIDDKHKNSPCEAIAATFMVHEDLIPYIKELKRQGDVLIVELTQDYTPSGNIVSLTADQYFSLLTAQS